MGAVVEKYKSTKRENKIQLKGREINVAIYNHFNLLSTK